tara:strand:- start:170 stop:439 length:270 start_codon:yes stop_codon:yes gene_type:complete
MFKLLAFINSLKNKSLSGSTATFIYATNVLPEPTQKEKPICKQALSNSNEITYEEWIKKCDKNDDQINKIKKTSLKKRKSIKNLNLLDT